MTESMIYDAIVVGAGVEGSATAYQLSKRGVRVLLLEQFPLPHSRGSSHGQTRITRKAYKEYYYTKMMEYCTKEWEAIQAAYGQVIYKKIGFMAIGRVKGQFIKDNVASLENNKATFELITPDKFQSRYPILKYGEGWGGVFDPEGGILMADKALHAYQTLFVKQGGQLRDGEPVLKIVPGDITQVITPRLTYRTKSVILCCGPWTNKMLSTLQLSLPLQPIRINVCYWPEKVPGSYSSEKLPCFFDMDTKEGREFYGLPSEEYPGTVKICLHYGPDIDPDSRDSVDSKWALDIASAYVRDHFPGLEAKPSVVETCIYTMTPDQDLILDRHPKWKNIIIGAGFSGHGFKLSPAVGNILADLSMNISSEYDISHFRMDRFPQTKTHNKSNL